MSSTTPAVWSTWPTWYTLKHDKEGSTLGKRIQWSPTFYSILFGQVQQFDNLMLLVYQQVSQNVHKGNWVEGLLFRTQGQTGWMFGVLRRTGHLQKLQHNMEVLEVLCSAWSIIACCEVLRSNLTSSPPRLQMSWQGGPASYSWDGCLRIRSLSQNMNKRHCAKVRALWLECGKQEELATSSQTN